MPRLGRGAGSVYGDCFRAQITHQRHQGEQVAEVVQAIHIVQLGCGGNSRAGRR
jgi:hypothetical protein